MSHASEFEVDYWAMDEGRDLFDDSTEPSYPEGMFGEMMKRHGGRKRKTNVASALRGCKKNGTRCVLDSKSTVVANGCVKATTKTGRSSCRSTTRKPRTPRARTAPKGMCTSSKGGCKRNPKATAHSPDCTVSAKGNCKMTEAALKRRRSIRGKRKRAAARDVVTRGLKPGELRMRPAPPMDMSAEEFWAMEGKFPEGMFEEMTKRHGGRKRKTNVASALRGCKMIRTFSTQSGTRCVLDPKSTVVEHGCVKATSKTGRSSCRSIHNKRKPRTPRARTAPKGMCTPSKRGCKRNPKATAHSPDCTVSDKGRCKLTEAASKRRQSVRGKRKRAAARRDIVTRGLKPGELRMRPAPPMDM